MSSINSRVPIGLECWRLTEPAGLIMKDIQNKLSLFLIEAEDCEPISKLATDPKKRELFRHLAERFHDMAAHLEAAADEQAKGPSSGPS